MGFSTQEYHCELSSPTSGYLDDPRSESVSLESPALADGFFTTAPPGNNLTYKINVRYQHHLRMGGGYQKTLDNQSKESSLMMKILVLQG